MPVVVGEHSSRQFGGAKRRRNPTHGDLNKARRSSNVSFHLPLRPCCDLLIESRVLGGLRHGRRVSLVGRP
jgi:hypothetical protein